MRENQRDDSPSQGDDAFEVTSLRPPVAPSVASQQTGEAASGLRPLRRLANRISPRGWRLLAAGGALLATLAIIVSMIPGVSLEIARVPRTTPTPTGSNSSGFLTLTLAQGPTGPTPTPNATTTTSGANYPNSCPGGITTMTDATPFAGTLGAGPVWFGSFQSGNDQPASVTLTALDGPSNQYGSPIQVALFIRSDTRGPVTIAGTDLAGGRPLWFSFVSIGNGRDPTPGALTPATSFSFTPQHPGPGVPPFWYASYGKLYLPGAGCYSLNAHWPDGGWRITFVAGG